ncbi:hypothetical protein IQ243_22990 [Nostocales cyanobacterium LEGE 11386]|nr:hypothetical protein [Nostocales cyanobacterium LEGE 11386]
MYTKEQIENIFGTQVIDYLTHKNTGGSNNSKGSKYENIYAVYLLALFARCVIECKQEIEFLSQCFAFLDDLIINCKQENLLRHYQLKNSASVNWGKGAKSIHDDFQKQYQLNQSISKNSELLLVVSCDKLRANLQNSMPKNISSYSQVIYFCPDISLPKIIAQQQDFKNALKYLCAFDNPEPDKLECVATVLLGAWTSSDTSQISVMDILKKAQESIPSYIRSFETGWQLDPEVENILNNIDGFTYNITRGFLHWEFQNGLDEGTLSYSIETERFQKFQELIKRNNPTSFEELEVFLI